VMARDNGWLAEHMLIIGITDPNGKKIYVAAAFPSQCGKTNMALMTPNLPGWKIETIGDDIAWMRVGQDGRLYAINPEYGFFGVCPGTNDETNPIAMRIIHRDSLFTNVALTEDGDIWWEGLTKEAPPNLTDWKGNTNWNPNMGPSSHPNSRFTSPLKNCPTIDPNWDSPNGVPISAILFGGRRKNTVPLVYESLNWNHGVFIGTSISSETTAAAVGQLGTLRHDPFAMLPFCGYNMGDYFQHWLDMGKVEGIKLPKIFGINWFRKDETGFLWPGFGENIRVLKWIFQRCEGTIEAIETPIGNLPQIGDIDISDLDIPHENLEKLLKIDKKGWTSDIEDLKEYYKIFGKHLPSELQEEINRISQHLNDY